MQRIRPRTGRRLAERPAGPTQPSEGAISTAHGTLSMSGLVLIGIGGIIGAGFFLGAGLPIRTAGPAVLLAFLFGALVNAQVTGALASLAIDDPQPGAFMTYAQKYVGAYAGFLEGWTYYIASVMTIASESVAMAIFSHLWIPFVPLWALTAVYAAVVLTINAFGVQNFGRVESLMSVMKIGALVGFIVFVGYLALHRQSVHAVPASHAGTLLFGRFFPMGTAGLFQSMLIVIFAYAGIGVFSTATSEMRNPHEISKAAWITVLGLTFLYVLSIGLTLMVIPWSHISTSKSPFVMALQQAGGPFLGDIFNFIILIASFSVMAGAVFSANQILRGLGTIRQAPGYVLRVNRRGTATGALAITTLCIGLTIIISYLLPANVYDFLISASSFFTFLNWFLILWAFLVWRHRRIAYGAHVSSLAFGHPVSSLVIMLFILFMTGYALLQPQQRYGFYAFAVLCVLISSGYVMSRGWRRRAQS